MMKKHLAIALLALVAMVGALALAACGGGTTAPASPKASTASPSPSASAASPAPSASSPAPSAKAAPTVDPAWAKVVEAAKKEGKVTMYGQWSTLVQDAYRKYFNAEYPEITLDFVTGSGSQTFQRIQTEQRSGKVLGDVGRSGSTSAREMKKAGVYEPFEPPVLNDTSLKWRDEKMARMDPTHNFNTFSFVIFSVLVNTNLVPAGQEPKAYKDLADPKWKGKMMAFSPKLSGQGSVWYNTVGKGVLGQQFYAGPDYLDKMKTQDIIWATNYDDAANLVARGEASLFFPATSASATRLRLANAPVKFLQMDHNQATVLGWGVIKGAPHPNAAKLFINWLGTTNGQKALQEGGDTPLRADIPITVPENDPGTVPIEWFPTDDSEAALYPSMDEAASFFGIK